MNVLSTVVLLRKRSNEKLRNESRYRFWKDVARMERVVASHKTKIGYVAFLTNDADYWVDATTENTVDREFRIDGNRDLVWGPLHWYSQNGQRVQNDDQKHPPVVLKNKYSLQNKWQTWGDPGLRCLVLEVLG